MRTALQGQFIDIMTILYVTEGTYLDWATRLLEAGRRPDTPKIYAEWIDITALKCSVSWWNGCETSSTTQTSAIAALKSSVSSHHAALRVPLLAVRLPRGRVGLMGLTHPLYPVDPCKTSGLSKDLTK